MIRRCVLNTRDGPQAIPPRGRHNSSTPSPPSAEVVPGGSLPAPADTSPDLTLPYDQITPERRAIGDATGRIGDHLGVLGVALAQWMGRDDSRADADVRRAASTALDAADAMLGELYALRARLVAEIRASDAAAADRADALLTRLGGDPP
jgi:hypothetical protein